RKQLGLTTRELASKAQSSHTTVSRLENGKQLPGRETLNRLAVIVGLSDEMRKRLFEASHRQRSLANQVGRLAALPLRWYEMADRKQRSLRERERGMRPQKGGRFIRNQRLGIRPGRRGGRR
ncbi:MAG: helix-turn-helix transcriptional regulator, partial [Candidatus Dormibacteraceae bacterium]